MTKEFIKARFFGSHIGAKVFMEKHKELDVIFRGVSKPISVDGFNLHCTRDERHAFIVPNAFIVPIDHCKLVLRPLSSITDEEAIECAGIALGEKCHKAIVRHGGWCVVKHKTSSEKDVYIGFEPSAGVWNEFGSSTKYDIAAYDYLRSKNFCLPFMGLDPVAEGWAILKA